MGCCCLKTQDNDNQKTINTINIEDEELKNQLKKYEKAICKINGKESGFLCKIKSNENITSVLLTNNNILKKEDISSDKYITLKLNGKEYSIKADNSRKIYINNDKYFITIIEIKKDDNLDLNTFFEIDCPQQLNDLQIYFIQNSQNKNNYYKGKIIRQIEEDSYKILYQWNNRINRNDFYLIINKKNNKIIGYTKGEKHISNYYLGFLFKNIITDFFSQPKLEKIGGFFGGRGQKHKKGVLSGQTFSP